MGYKVILSENGERLCDMHLDSSGSRPVIDWMSDDIGGAAYELVFDAIERHVEKVGARDGCLQIGDAMLYGWTVAEDMCDLVDGLLRQIGVGIGAGGRACCYMTYAPERHEYVLHTTDGRREYADTDVQELIGWLNEFCLAMCAKDLPAGKIEDVFADALLARWG